MQRIMTHVLKGKTGMSKLQLEEIDVEQVISMSYRKRWFAILDRDARYSLTVEYDQQSHSAVLPVIVAGGHVGFALNNVDDSSVITKRYASAEDCIREITEITEKQSMVESYRQAIRKEIMEKYK